MQATEASAVELVDNVTRRTDDATTYGDLLALYAHMKTYAARSFST